MAKEGEPTSLILGAAEGLERFQFNLGLLVFGGALAGSLIIPGLAAFVEPAGIFTGIKFAEMKAIQYFRDRPSRRASKMQLKHA